MNPTRTMGAANRLLDRTVGAAHHFAPFEGRYHPYFIASDAAALLGLTVAWAFSARHPGVGFWGFVSIFILVLAAYRGALLVKAALLGTSSRSLLQDTLLFLLPLYALLSWASGHLLSAAFDLAALVLAVYFGAVRVGCFLGGCCYGVASSFGVFYPEVVFRPLSGWRRFTAGPNPGSRVFPVQLLEAAGHFGLFAWLWQDIAARGGPDGLALVRYFAAYGLARFGLDFLRQSSARPRRGRYSEGQWVSLCTAAVATAVLGLHHWVKL